MESCCVRWIALKFHKNGKEITEEISEPASEIERERGIESMLTKAKRIDEVSA